MIQPSSVHSTFVIERTINAAPSRVFAAFATDEAKRAWFGGGAFEPGSRTFDFRVGGREHLSGRWTNGVVHKFDLIYYDIVENHRLVYAYEMHLDDARISVSLATIEFVAAGDKTRFTLTEQGVYLDGYDDAGRREHGTTVMIDKLVALFDNAKAET